MVTYCRMDDL